jgi:hypothetical protein
MNIAWASADAEILLLSVGSNNVSRCNALFEVKYCKFPYLIEI